MGIKLFMLNATDATGFQNSNNTACLHIPIQLHCKYITLFDISMQYKENKNTKNENYFYNLFLLEAISSRIPTK